MDLKLCLYDHKNIYISSTKMNMFTQTVFKLYVNKGGRFHSPGPDSFKCETSLMTFIEKNY